MGAMKVNTMKERRDNERGESEQKERGKWVLSEYVILPSDF